MMSAKVLVTGAPGWLGTRFVETLIQGLPEVPGLERPLPGLQVRCLVAPGADVQELLALGPQVECVRGDLRDPASLTPFLANAEGATLVHSAAVIHPRWVREFEAVNTRGTRALLVGARAAGLRRFVHVSTTAVVGLNEHHDEHFGDEETCRPYMGYGRSKYQAEQVVHAMAAQGGIETVIARLPWFYGPRQPERQTEFFSMIRDGRGPLIGGGHNRRSMSYIDNSCQGLMLAMRSDAAVGQTYWFADRQAYTLKEVVDTVERVLERDFGIPVAGRRLRLPAVASSTARAADRLSQRLGIYLKRVHVLGELDRTIAVTIDKAERELGYDPKVALEEGMRRSVAWILERGGLD